MVMTGTNTLMHNQQASSMMGLNPMMGDMSGMQMPMGMANMQAMGSEMSGQYNPNIGGLPPQGNENLDVGQAHALPQDGYVQSAHNMGMNDYTGQVSHAILTSRSISAAPSKAMVKVGATP
jgi:pre-mRNA 3'-end-processing factor FIP1